MHISYPLSFKYNFQRECDKQQTKKTAYDYFGILNAQSKFQLKVTNSHSHQDDNNGNNENTAESNAKSNAESF